MFIPDPRQANEHTAFTAYLDLGHKPLHNGETLIFNRVLYNEGNTYNTANGIFNCKISGVYLFSLFFGVQDSHHALLKIVIDGSNQVDGIAESTAHGFDVQGGNMLITHLNAGQSVWVTQYYFADAVIRGEPNYHFTTFSGVLLYWLIKRVIMKNNVLWTQDI